MDSRRVHPAKTNTITPQYTNEDADLAKESPLRKVTAPCEDPEQPRRGRDVSTPRGSADAHDAGCLGPLPPK